MRPSSVLSRRHATSSDFYETGATSYRRFSPDLVLQTGNHCHGRVRERRWLLTIRRNSMRLRINLPKPQHATALGNEIDAFGLRLLQTALCLLRTFRPRLLFMALFVGSISSLLEAQIDAQRAMADNSWSYISRSWQSQNGLAGETVQSFAETQDGFLWIGT